jgi:hypothetical protein
MISFSIKGQMAVLCFLLIVMSCSKANDSSNNNGTIVGAWSLSEFGIDNNSNDIIDAGETKTAAQIGAYGSLTLNSNNTYSTMIFDGANPYSESGTYDFLNGVIRTTTGRGTFNDYKVLTLTNNRLVIKQTTSSPANWIIYTK